MSTPSTVPTWLGASPGMSLARDITIAITRGLAHD